MGLARREREQRALSRKLQQPTLLCDAPATHAPAPRRSHNQQLPRVFLREAVRQLARGWRGGAYRRFNGDALGR